MRSGILSAYLLQFIIHLFITAGFIITFTMGSCSSGKCSATFPFTIGRNMVDGYDLLGHVFANVSVAGVLDCYKACQPNCRCISFNFLTNANQDNCQLNEENRHLKPGALVPMEGSQYYDLVINYNIWACTQCYNSCCRDQPCHNGGTCRENCQTNGKRFICNCSEGFTGKLCEKGQMPLHVLPQQDCRQALGMESGAISDGQLSASSAVDDNRGAKYARLHGEFDAKLIKGGSWVAAKANLNQWLQIDLLNQYTILTRVATQGRNSERNNRWVTKYQLQYSNETASFRYYREQGQNTDEVFDGNNDKYTVVSHDLNPPITARYIRFRPVKWLGKIAMRVELYGCHWFLK